MSKWRDHHLIDLTEKIGSGATPRGGKEAYKPAGTPLIRSQNVLDFTFSDSGLAFIDDDQAEKLKNVIVETGDILINITGDSVARVCEAPANFLPARVNQHVAILRPSVKLSNGFLKYYLLTPRNKGKLLMLASSGATRNALTKGMLESFKINLPPLPEQKAIAHILGTLDDKIELNRKMNETLEQMAQALFKSWFVDFDPVIDKALAAGNPIPEPLQKRAQLRQALPNDQKLLHARPELVEGFPDSFTFTEELGWIPEGWEVKQIMDFGRVVCGKTPSKSVPENFDDSSFPFIKIPSMHGQMFAVETEEYVSEVGAQSQMKKLIPKNSICVSCIATVGLVSITTSDSFTNQQINSVILNNLHLREYLYFYLKSLNRVFHDRASGGSATLNMNTGIFSRVEVLKPTIEALAGYHQLTYVSFQKILGNQLEMVSLSKLRDTLLPKLISGELRVPEADLSAGQAGNQITEHV